MVKYEHKLLNIDIREAENALNNFGQEGWELAFCMEASPSVVRLFLRRSINEQFLAGV